MKKLLIFLAGIFTGVMGLTLYELFGVPALPDDDYHEWTEDELLGIDKLFTPDELDELVSLEDTQPVYIGADDELFAWRLGARSRESE
jgi:hypothetical protein